jgi:predicted RNase H-like HicB family nuclease
MFGYLAVVRPDDTEAAYHVEFPDLPGCTCDAPTVDEALSNAETALRAHMETLERRGRPVPRPRPSHHMIAAAARADAVAAACLRAPTR